VRIRKGCELARIPEMHGAGLRHNMRRIREGEDQKGLRACEDSRDARCWTTPQYAEDQRGLACHNSRDTISTRVKPHSLATVFNFYKLKTRIN
jgi:hypothetical protein